ISGFAGLREITIQRWNRGRVAVVINKQVWTIDTGIRDALDLFHRIGHINGEIIVTRHVDHYGPLFFHSGPPRENPQITQRRISVICGWFEDPYLKSLISTMSLVADQRYVAILPSREIAKLVTNSDL